VRQADFDEIPGITDVESEGISILIMFFSLCRPAIGQLQCHARKRTRLNIASTILNVRNPRFCFPSDEKSDFQLLSAIGPCLTKLFIE
jgi:hypothetical protein